VAVSNNEYFSASVSNVFRPRWVAPLICSSRVVVTGFQLPNLLTVRVRVTLRLALYRQSVRLGDKPLETHDSNFIFQLNTCGSCPYVTFSLTRWVCHLQLLLVLASAVILRPVSRGSNDHILLSQMRNSPNLEGQVPAFISPRNRVAQLYPQTLGRLTLTHHAESILM
jgi:hypothetical protein